MEFESKLGFRSVYAPIDLRELTEFEASLPGGHLPADYRRFLLEWNGGYFDVTPPDCPTIRYVGFPLKDSDEFDEPGDIGQLEGLYDASHGHDLRKLSDGYGFRSAVPREYIVIGHGLSWNRVCICVTGDDAGHIYFWTPGEPWPEEPEPTRQFLHPIANSFREFWDELYVLPDDLQLCVDVRLLMPNPKILADAGVAAGRDLMNADLFEAGFDITVVQCANTLAFGLGLDEEGQKARFERRYGKYFRAIYYNDWCDW